jgi:tRNA A-37 threonylcarbamoyl transferase component Bud32
MEQQSSMLGRMSRLEREVTTRLTRIESKVVRGFEELGISTDKNPDWLTVDEDARVVYVDTIGRSLMVLLSDMARAGAEQYGKHYEVVHKGSTVATVELRKLI